jgi:hypothetical protein
MLKSLLVIVNLALTTGVYAQEPGLTARQLYLQEDDPIPNIDNKHAISRPGLPPKSAPVPHGNQGSGQVAAPGPRAAAHLGVRYNLLMVDPASKATQEVDPDANFRVGDCLAVRFTPNRTGYMYVFNEGSSGIWHSMLPSSLMPDESNGVTAGINTQVPKGYCFKVSDPSGTDNLVVVLTEKSEDMYRLNEAIKESSQARGKATSSGQSDLVRLVDSMTPGASRDGLTSRDLEIEKVGQPQAPNEPPNSVYIVNTGAKADRVVIKIKIRHE